MIWVPPMQLVRQRNSLPDERKNPPRAPLWSTVRQDQDPRGQSAQHSSYIAASAPGPILGTLRTLLKQSGPEHTVGLLFSRRTESVLEPAQDRSALVP